MDGFHLDRLGLGYTVQAGSLSDHQLLVGWVTSITHTHTHYTP